MIKLRDIIIPAYYEAHKDIKERKHTHYWFKGGRGSTKSSFISIEIIYNIIKDSECNAICFRKIGKDIEESVYNQILWAIDILGVNQYFKAYKSPYRIIYLPTGQVITFRGLDDATKTKSIKLKNGYYKISWFEELDEFAGLEEIRKAEQSIMRGGNEFIAFKSYNPPQNVNSWVNKEVQHDRADRLIIHNSYLDVPPEWLGEQFFIEAEYLKKLNELSYRHEYLGEVTGTGGLIFQNAKDIRLTDEEIKRFDNVREGIDWGFACLKGDTLVSTDKGNIPIKDIKIGDNVLTREGYKKVLFTQNKGIKEVYSIDFGYGNSIIATGDHIIFTYDGWKRVDELRGVEKLCVMKSNLMAEFIKGIQRGNIQTISTIKQKLKAEFTIEMCGNIIMELFQKAMLFITLILTHLIMILVILFVSLPLNILKYIINIIWVQYQKKECNKSEQKTDIRKKTGKKEEKNQSKQFKKKEEYVKNVVNLLQLPMFIKNTVHRIVEKEQIQELAKKNIFVNTVVNTLCLLLTMKEKHVQQNVPIKLTLLKDKAEVFDITVENGEFFANGILVHNCDPFAWNKLHYDKTRRCIYIYDEIHKTGLTNARAIELIKPKTQVAICADSAEPKSIAEFQVNNVQIFGAKKGIDSVRYGIKWLQNLTAIYIDKVRCPHTFDEFTLYELEKDKNGEFKDKYPDKNNHHIDTIRYALESDMNSYNTKVIGMRPF